MIFWNVSIVTVLIIALIELFSLMMSKHIRLSYRKFLSTGKAKPKSCMVVVATYMSADWWN